MVPQGSHFGTVIQTHEEAKWDFRVLQAVVWQAWYFVWQVCVVRQSWID